MPNKKGKRVSSEDAQSAAESLFGETTAKPASAVSEDQDAEDRTEQERQGQGVPEEQAVGDEAAPAKNETDGERQDSEVAQEQPGSGETETNGDLKVVVSIRGGFVTIGVQRPSSDPHVERIDAQEISGLVQEVPAVIERARANWEEAPKHPAYVRPTRSNGRRSRREQGSTQDSTTEGQDAQQQPQTLRLL